MFVKGYERCTLIHFTGECQIFRVDSERFNERWSVPMGRASPQERFWICPNAITTLRSVFNTDRSKSAAVSESAPSNLTESTVDAGGEQ